MISRKPTATATVLAIIISLGSTSALGETIIELARTTVDMKGPGPFGTSTGTPGRHHAAAFTFEVNTSFGGETEAPSAGWLTTPLTLADIGRTFVFDANTNDSFSAVAARLTDGEPGTYGLGEDVLFFGISVGGGGGGHGPWEHHVFHDNSLLSSVPDDFELNTQLFVPFPTKIDLHGAMLSHIVMRIDSLAMHFVDNLTLSRGGYTLSFFGVPPVPEPPAGVAIASFVALAWLVRRR